MNVTRLVEPHNLLSNHHLQRSVNFTETRKTRSHDDYDESFDEVSERINP